MQCFTCSSHGKILARYWSGVASFVESFGIPAWWRRAKTDHARCKNEQKQHINVARVLEICVHGCQGVFHEFLQRRSVRFLALPVFWNTRHARAGANFWPAHLFLCDLWALDFFYEPALSFKIPAWRQQVYTVEELLRKGHRYRTFTLKMLYLWLHVLYTWLLRMTLEHMKFICWNFPKVLMQKFAWTAFFTHKSTAVSNHSFMQCVKHANSCFCSILCDVFTAMFPKNGQGTWS